MKTGRIKKQKLDVDYNPSPSTSPHVSAATSTPALGESKKARAVDITSREEYITDGFSFAADDDCPKQLSLGKYYLTLA